MDKEDVKARVMQISAVVLILIVAVLVYYFASFEKISEIKDDDSVGDTIMVRGEVTSVIKISSLSGYTLEDKTGSISVSSEDLPKEGDKVTVRGTLMKDSLFGFYIKDN